MRAERKLQASKQGTAADGCVPSVARDTVAIFVMVIWRAMRRGYVA